MSRIAVIALLLLPVIAASQEETGGQGVGGTEIIRGHVRTSEARAIDDALVTVTGLQSRTARTTHTNAKGLYTVLFTDGEGEYLVTVRSIGFVSTTVRVSRSGEMNVLVADVVLGQRPLQLDSVIVLGKGGRPLPSADARKIGSDERDVLGGALFSLDPSDLSALAAAVPGVMMIPGANGRPGSFSVLGMSPDQNNVLVDGSTFGGNALPPDAIASATVATTTFDPSRGGFSGGQMSIRTRRGTDKFEASFRGGLAHPRLAWADPASATPLPRSLTWSGGASGPIKRGMINYMAAFSTNDLTSELRSLLELDDLQLSRYGLARDTIDALAANLDHLGVPLTIAGIPDHTTGVQRSASLRLDATPSATTSFTVSGTGAESRQLGAGISALGFPSQGGGSRSTNLALQLSASSYVAGFVDELKTSLQRASAAAEPFLFEPQGTVRVGADYVDGHGGLTTLAFGGGTAGITRSDTRSWESTNELSWLTSDSRNRLQLGQSFTHLWTSATNVQNPFGTFVYQSLADLAANRPASYSRTLSSFERSTKAMSGALWAGGQWRSAKDVLQLQYGLRLDMARSGTVPQYNAVIDSLFGRRTDQVPGDMGWSPRLGFSWTPDAKPAVTTPQRFSQRFGQRAGQRPISISGGIGIFRGVIAPSRVASMVDATGLPNTMRQLTCVGDATPVPDWTRYLSDQDALPAQCLDGTAPAVFSTDKPNVQLFDSSFRAPLSWRGNLQVQGLSFKGWPLGVSATYSLGYNGESGIDLNLRRTPVFTLPAEGNRPVFVPPDAIVPSTGAVAPGASRVTERFGSVMSYVSDLQTVATQLSLSLVSPEPLFGKAPLQISYIFSRARAQARGITGSTAGDPFVREWAAAQQPTHQFVMATQFGIKFITVSLRATLMSGRPYTPMVVGDVNGDGQNDDRAFIFDPATTPDTALARQMGDLLTSAPSRTRACLQSQLGRVAGRNSCRTGWSLQPDVNVGLRLPDLPWQQKTIGGFDDRLKLSFTTINAMGALLRLLRLSNTNLGWATSANSYLDPNLLYVDGFDPTTQQLQYRVNQQFGDGRVQRRSRAGRRGISAPFQVQLGAELKFGGPPHQSMAQQLGLAAADKKTQPLTTEQVKERLRTLVSNPVSLLLRMKDTLLLTAQQIERIQAIEAQFEARSDSLFAPLVQYLSGEKVKDADLQKRIGKLFPKVLQMMIASVEEVRAVLTEEQLQQLPAFFREAGKVKRKEKKPR